MNQLQSRHFLNLKLQTRNYEAKCKALAEEKDLSSLFAQDIQQMHYKAIQGKVLMASVLKKMSTAHNKVLVDTLHQYSKTIKSNTNLLNTINTRMNDLMDKEKNMMETQEDTVLSIRDAIESECEQHFESGTSPSDFDDSISLLLPKVPTDPVKRLDFSNVLIKTIDEFEDDKQLSIQANEEEEPDFNESSSNDSNDDSSVNPLI